MRAFRRFLLGAALVFPVLATATTMLALDLVGLTRTADTVVRGRVVSSQARWSANHSRIITDTTIEVTDTLKGHGTKTVVVMQPGGEVGEVGQHVEGVARFQKDEEVVVFLEARGTERFTLSGMAQGRFKVERAADGTVRARQDQCADLYLVDRDSRQPTSRAPIDLPLEDLRQRIAASERP
jgi:hypothetical protein